MVFTFRNCKKETVVKKVLTLIMALGLVVAFTSAAVAMGICGGPKTTQLQANADTQQNRPDRRGAGGNDGRHFPGHR